MVILIKKLKNASFDSLAFPGSGYKMLGYGAEKIFFSIKILMRLTF